MNARPRPSLVTALSLDRPDDVMLWLYFGCGAAMAAVLAVVFGFAPLATPGAVRGPAVVACAGLSLCFAACGAAAIRGQAAGALQLASWSSVATAAVVGVALGQGVHTLAFGFLAVIVCLGCTMVSLRAGAALLAGCSVLMIGLAAAEQLGRLQPVPGQSLWAALVTQLMMLVTGFIAGLMLQHVLGRFREEGGAREQRVRSLLNIAADWYWEQDAQLRFTYVSDTFTDDHGVAPWQQLGRTRWEIPELELTPQEWAAHRRELEARRPFRDFVMRRPDVGGMPRWVSISGEPFYDDNGRFMGYWGVGRHITTEVLAQRALRASEARYRELFARSPSPMVVHRRGIVLEANEAAAAMLGYRDVPSLIGANVVMLYRDGDSRDRAAARIADGERMPLGGMLPTAEFELVAPGGRNVAVQSTGLRVQLHDGPATLSIYTDLSDRKATEQALRRSQTLLMHLFDTTPDTVSLSELTTGRYVMLNQHFTKVLGWTAEEAIGRTAAELGIWRRAADADRLVRTLREQGVVQEMPMMFAAKSGAQVPLNVSAARFTLERVEYLVIVARDMSMVERARLEREAILQHASIGIAFTRERHFAHANPRFEQMFGWPPGSLAGQSNLVIWGSQQEYADVARIAGPLLAVGKPYEEEREMRRRDGTRFWCRLVAQTVDPSDPNRSGTIWIGEDVTERRQAAQALSSARDAAEAANRAKSAFLANTSHEIRTPLNGLLGLARLAQQPQLDAHRRQQYLQQIFDSAHSLSAIISDILDLSKIEAGKLSLETLSFDLRATVGATCRGYEALAGERGLLLSLRFADSVPGWVRGDPVRVRQILGNFLSNALKFTEHGSVQVEITALAGGVLRFAVSDTGPGIESDVLARLFRPFTQADESTTRRYGGSGLGLSICRELATLMGGEVGVESMPGRGSRFWAELPLPATSGVGESDSGSTLDDAALLRRLAGARVLVVEDNPVNMLITCAMLEAWDVRFTSAGDGQQALDAVEQAERDGRLFDAVLMDVQMPVMSGHEAARRLRARFEPSRLPIIALTAAALVSEREQAMASGMDAFLTKPIDAEQLQRVLAQAVGRRVPLV